MPRKGARRGPEEGATAVEAAIVFSVLFLLIFGIIEFGMALWQWNTMLLAVEQAGRYVMVHNSCGTNCAEGQMQLILTSASSTCSGAPAANQIYICATTPSPQTTPPTMTLTASYGYNVLGITGTQVVTSQGTFPLD